LIPLGFDWFRCGCASRALKEADTKAMIARFGHDAYSEAPAARSHGEPYDGPAQSRQLLLKAGDTIRPVLALACRSEELYFAPAISSSETRLRGAERAKASPRPERLGFVMK
jgi:hypothetical protein